MPVSSRSAMRSISSPAASSVSSSSSCWTSSRSSSGERPGSGASVGRGSLMTHPFPLPALAKRGSGAPEVVDPTGDARHIGDHCPGGSAPSSRTVQDRPDLLDISPMLPSGIAALDARLIQAMCQTPRAGVMELARQLGVARGTVQARLDKLQRRGVISGFDPELDLQAMGY